MHSDIRSLLDSEREFHDQRYQDGDNREAQLKYYWSVSNGARQFSALVEKLATASDVLEYGCGVASRAGELADRYRSFCGIDISEMAIDQLRAKYSASNTSFHVMDAMNMDFPDGSFDLVFGSGIIHHLDTELCSRELLRVLRPGGDAVFWEPLGNNPLINAYRWMTPNARTRDEHPLVGRDFSIMRRHFRTVEVELYGLTSIAAVPLRGFSFGRGVRDALARADELLLKVPGVQKLAWYSCLRCIK